jgi:hypothetical protein
VGALRAAALGLLLVSCRWDFERSSAGGDDGAGGGGGADGFLADGENGLDARLPGDGLQPDAFVCADPYVSRPTGCYYFERVADLLWVDAEAECERLGSHLAVIDSEAENAMIVSELFGSSWLGHSDRVVEASFIGVTGRSPGVALWAPNQPMGQELSDCVVLWNDTWREERCDAFYYPYVCESDGTPADPGAY